MGLAAGARYLNEISIRKSIGLAENRSRDRNFLVSRELTDDLSRSLGDRRQAAAELDKGRILDALNEMDENIVKNANLLFIETISVAKEQVCNATQRFNALLRRATSGQ